MQGSPVKPRLLLSFPFAESGGGWNIPLGESCAQALEEMGFEVCRFNPVEEKIDFPGRKALERLLVLGCRLGGVSKERAKRLLPWDEEHRRFQRLSQVAEQFRPEVVLVVSTFTYPQEVLDRLRRQAGVRHLLGWCVEGPSWMRSPVAEAALYDSYFCIHRHGIGPESGIGYLPAIAYDPGHYRRLQPALPKCRDICFVGRLKDRRRELLGQILDYDLHLFGPGWDQCGEAFRPRMKGAVIVGDALNRLYNESKIVLNVSAWENDGQDCPNLRIADVPATGSFLLSDYSDYAAELFKPGVEMEFYSSVAELRDKLDFYLANDAAREKIAQAGYARALRLETYPDKMRTLLSQSAVPLPEPCQAGRRT